MQRRVAYLPLETLIRSLVKWTFWAFGRPFEAVRADDGVSRRDECISTGRERPGSSPRGPGVVLELCSEVDIFWKILQSDTLQTPASGTRTSTRDWQ